MNPYFDIRNGHIAIIETDTPDPGWIKLTSEQSRLAVRYRLGDDGKVIDAYPGKTDEEVLAAIAEQQAAQEQSTEPSSSRVLTKLQFLNRFTNEELAAVYTAAKTNVLIEVFMDKLKLAQDINLDDPQTVGGLQTLVAAGLLSEARVQEVLA